MLNSCKKYWFEEDFDHSPSYAKYSGVWKIDSLEWFTGSDDSGTLNFRRHSFTQGDTFVLVLNESLNIHKFGAIGTLNLFGYNSTFRINITGTTFLNRGWKDTHYFEFLKIEGYSVAPYFDNEIEGKYLMIEFVEDDFMHLRQSLFTNEFARINNIYLSKIK
jgi:hypothetical protein